VIYEKGAEKLEESGVNVRALLKCILKKEQGESVGIGFIWLKTDTRDELL
jgi:hypothetical protein